MTATTKSFKELAAEANSYLFREKRADGTPYLIPLNEAPEWFTDLCRTAHGEFLPDDWRYEFIQDALNACEEQDDWDDTDVIDLDSLYPYTMDRLRWLSSNLNRYGYCDEAMEEYGPTGEILVMIGAGMQRELEEVFRAVADFLKGMAEDQGDGE